jgi:hypothetical protein
MKQLSRGIVRVVAANVGGDSFREIETRQQLQRRVLRFGRNAADHRALVSCRARRDG